MNYQDISSHPENSKREQLKVEIRDALGKFPEFTGEVIGDFLQKIEMLEQALRDKPGQDAELLCPERVQAMLHFLHNEKNASQFTRTLQEVGLPEVVKALLKTLAIQKEYSQMIQENQDDLRKKMREKFSGLRGVTAEKVDKLMLSIDAVANGAKVKLSDQLIQPFLNIDHSELEQALDERGADRVFPEIVNSFYVHMKRVIQMSN